MNRKIFIYTSLIAVIISVTCFGYAYVPVKNAVSNNLVALFHFAPHKSSQYSFDYKSNQKRSERNKVRIKAWDDSSSMDRPPDFIVPYRLYFIERPFSHSYQNVICSAHLSLNFLRGPPII